MSKPSIHFDPQCSNNRSNQLVAAVCIKPEYQTTERSNIANIEILKDDHNKVYLPTADIGQDYLRKLIDCRNEDKEHGETNFYLTEGAQIDLPNDSVVSPRFKGKEV